MSQVKVNDTIKVHYTGKLEDGQIFDTSENREPLEFTVGSGMLIPGFENGVIDMKVNEKRTLNIPSAEAYGAVNQDLFQEVEKSLLPPEINPEVGMGLMSQSPDGREMPLTITEVRENTIVVDANHPLAGKDLTFEIELVEIK
ncbi:MAG: peptidylprolyl isomerase [Crocinitomicaceae bacterium]|nr:peptidylprolyl isomerase [Crocinitomicaceae bacterium]|tara:strand:- start:7421 stop:7849 length:429 start_codon:yes stop_codon:yes gene_type:complete